jgi:hypothetical protein
MSRNDGALALRLDFGTITTTAKTGILTRPRMRLASGAASDGPRKYALLERRRRRAQIRARRLLDVLEDQAGDRASDRDRC